MDEFLVLCIALAILGTLIAGGIAFILVLVLRGRVKRLEGRIAIIERRGAPEEEPRMAPAPAPEFAPPVPAHAAVAPVVSPPAAEPALAAAPPPASSWAESFESRLGTRWLSWIGALVIVVAIALLLSSCTTRG